MVQMSEEGYEALRRARDDAEAANKAKSEFLATMSHELRTPLNAIIGFSELMMRGVLGPVGNENYLSYIKDIHLSGRRLLDIINDILEFSKAEAGKLELLECEVDVAEVVAALLRLIGPKARDAGLAVRERLPQHLPRLWCDESEAEADAAEPALQRGEVHPRRRRHRARGRPKRGRAHFDRARHRHRHRQI